MQLAVVAPVSSTTEQPVSWSRLAVFCISMAVSPALACGMHKSVRTEVLNGCEISDMNHITLRQP